MVRDDYIAEREFISLLVKNDIFAIVDMCCNDIKKVAVEYCYMQFCYISPLSYLAFATIGEALGGVAKDIICIPNVLKYLTERVSFVELECSDLINMIYSTKSSMYMEDFKTIQSFLHKAIMIGGCGD